VLVRPIGVVRCVVQACRSLLPLAAAVPGLTKATGSGRSPPFGDTCFRASPTAPVPVILGAQDHLVLGEIISREVSGETRRGLGTAGERDQHAASGQPSVCSGCLRVSVGSGCSVKPRER
jgi:hypothetical protein